MVDSPSRLINLRRFLAFFDHFAREADIVVVEQGSVPELSDLLSQSASVQHLFIESKDCHWKTRNLNRGAQLSSRPNLLMADCDIVPHPEAVRESAHLLASGQDFVQLYNGILVNLTEDYCPERTDWNEFVDQLRHFSPRDVDQLAFDETSTQYPMFGNTQYLATGGCTACHRSSFFNAGGWNENFVSYGFEDMEFDERARKLGYKVTRLPDHNAYHFDHPRGADSYYSTFYRTNEQEYERVLSMTPEQLREYVNRGFRLIDLRHDREYELINSPAQYSWSSTSTSRVDLSTLSIVIGTSRSEVGYARSCLRQLLDYLEEGFSAYEVRICEFGGTNYKHIHNKKNIIYCSFGEHGERTEAFDQAHAESRRAHFLTIVLSADAEQQLVEIIDQFDALKSGASCAEVFSIASCPEKRSEHDQQH